MSPNGPRTSKKWMNVLNDSDFWKCRLSDADADADPFADADRHRSRLIPCMDAATAADSMRTRSVLADRFHPLQLEPRR